jgi:hypothetical protein
MKNSIFVTFSFYTSSSLNDLNDWLVSTFNGRIKRHNYNTLIKELHEK